MPSTLRSLAMTSPPDDVDTVHDFVESVWAAHSGVSQHDRICFETAVVELASNVMRHADTGGGVTCTLDIGVHEDALEATFTDSGKPANISPRRRSLPDEMAESGRGIPLITALVDLVEYDNGDGLNRCYVSRARTS